MLSQLMSRHDSLQEPTPELPFKKFRIVLIKPSKYDDDGYVIRFWKGVLPSNTLNVLHGLTEEVKSSGVFGALSIEIVTFDETAEKLPVKKNYRLEPAPLYQACGWVGGSPNQPVSTGLRPGSAVPRCWDRCDHGRIPHERHHQHAGRSRTRYPGAG